MRRNLAPVAGQLVTFRSIFPHFFLLPLTALCSLVTCSLFPAVSHVRVCGIFLSAYVIISYSSAVVLSARAMTQTPLANCC